jgi:hypothetical protein
MSMEVLIRDLHPPCDYEVVWHGAMDRHPVVEPVAAPDPLPVPWKPRAKMLRVYDAIGADVFTVQAVIAKTGLQPRQVREAIASLLRNRRIARVYEGAPNRWIAFYRATDVGSLRTPRVAVAGGDIEPGTRD